MPTRPTGPTGLPPQTRIDRSPPHDRVRRTSGQSLDRAPNGLEHQEIRPDRTPLLDGIVETPNTLSHSAFQVQITNLISSKCRILPISLCSRIFRRAVGVDNFALDNACYLLSGQSS